MRSSLALVALLVSFFGVLPGRTQAAASSKPDARCFDLNADFSTNSNPNGNWQYGWKDKVNGPLTLLTAGAAKVSPRGAQGFSWQFNENETPAVSALRAESLTGGTSPFDLQQVVLTPGQDGAPEGYAVARFTMPKREGGYFRIEAEARNGHFGLDQGDSEFHVIVGDRSVFDRFLIPHESCSYTNAVLLEEGVTVDFVVGRGADGKHGGSRLVVDAKLCPIPTPSVKEVPEIPSVVFDLAQDFTGTRNPNGVWRFGSKRTLNQPFKLLSQSRSSSDRGARVCCWALDDASAPTVCQVTDLEPSLATNSSIRIGGVHWAHRKPSEPSDYGITRFAVPPGLGGSYRLECMAVSAGAEGSGGPFQFQVLLNETNTLLTTNVSSFAAAFTADIPLRDGDLVDFVIRLDAETGLASAVDLMARLTAWNPSFSVECGHPSDGVSASWNLDGNVEESRQQAVTSVGGAPSFVPGRLGEAIQFGGRDDAIAVKACDAINIGDRPGFTVEFWIRPESLEGWGALLEWTPRNGPLPGMHIYTSVNGSGTLFGNLLDTSGNSRSFWTAPGVIVLSRFQHVALTYDRRTGLARFYRDGYNVATASLGSFTPDTTYDLWIGRRLLGGRSYRFQGSLDELSLYARPLAASEVRIRSLGLCRSTGRPPAQTNTKDLTRLTNQCPVALPCSALATDDSPVQLNLLGFDSDGDPLIYQVGKPSHGTLTGSAPNLTYVPSPSFRGLVTFTFTVSDGRMVSPPAQVSIIVGSRGNSPDLEAR